MQEVRHGRPSGAKRMQGRGSNGAKRHPGWRRDEGRGSTHRQDSEQAACGMLAGNTAVTRETWVESPLVLGCAPGFPRLASGVTISPKKNKTWWEGLWKLNPQSRGLLVWSSPRISLYEGEISKGPLTRSEQWGTAANASQEPFSKKR